MSKAQPSRSGPTGVASTSTATSATDEGSKAARKQADRRPRHDIVNLNTGDTGRTIVLHVYVLGGAAVSIDDLEQAEVSLTNALRKVKRQIVEKNPPPAFTNLPPVTP